MADDPKDLFGKSIDLNQLMGQAQQIISDLGKKKEEFDRVLQKEVVEAGAGGGMVKVKADGTGRVVSITFDKTLLQPLDAELLQDVTMAAVNEALRRAQATADRARAQLVGGLGLDGLLGGKP